MLFFKLCRSCKACTYNLHVMRNLLVICFMAAYVSGNSNQHCEDYHLLLSKYEPVRQFIYDWAQSAIAISPDCALIELRKIQVRIKELDNYGAFDELLVKQLSCESLARFPARFPLFFDDINDLVAEIKRSTQN